MTAVLLDAVGQYLVTSSASLPSAQRLKLGVNLFLGNLPAEAPNSVVLVQQYEGQPPTFTMGSAVSALESPRIQLLVRGEPEDYPTTYNWAYALRNLLGAITTRQTIDGINLLRIAPQGIPNPMPYDEVKRPRFTTNFQVTMDTP
jgi:hypothetical protein